MKQIEKNKVEMKYNANLSTLWIDSLNVNVRTDNHCLLRFFSNLPEGIFEQSRVMTSRENLISFVDVLCASLDYYPTKSQKVE